MSLELELQSMDGNVKIPISAYATEKVTGNLKTINWNKHKHQWNYLKNLTFPAPAERPWVDILIGLDYSDLHV